MSREKVKPHVAERVLGHTQGGVEGIYDRHAYLTEKGNALLKVEKAVLKILNISQSKEKIIRLRSAGV